ncbi:MAG: hypothetical protein HGA45_40375 [Chloroflexales bacterium]|nr:hypothetical protein [Chloroflexales bacterium]
MQIFATDVDARAIAQARSGSFPASIAADLTPARLERWFLQEPEQGRYRIRKVIRDLVIFSEQDVIKDPPFSRLDLLSCRNLLIYLNADLQRRLIPLFHYALNPGARSSSAPPRRCASSSRSSPRWSAPGSSIGARTTSPAPSARPSARLRLSPRRGRPSR